MPKLLSAQNGNTTAENDYLHQTESPLKKSFQPTAAEALFLKNNQPLKVCIDPDWMPFEGVDGQGRHQGISADILALIAKKTEIVMEKVNTVNWKQTLEYAKQGKCDLVPMTMKTIERSRYLNFTRPYYFPPLVIATARNHLFINSITDIKDRKLVSGSDYAFNEILRQRYPEIHIDEVTNVAEGLRRVSTGQYFGYIDSLPTIAYKIQQLALHDLRISGKLDQNWQLSIAVKKDVPELLSLFNKALDAISAEELNTIYHHWNHFTINEGVDFNTLRNSLMIMTVLFIILVLWNRSLGVQKKKVEQAMQMLSKAKEEAEQASRYKSIFLANMSHEIRTPMNAVIGMLQLMKKTDLSDRQQNYVYKAHRSANHLLQILNDILDFSKIEAGKIELENVDFSLQEVIQNTLMLTELKAREKSIHLSCDISADIPDNLIGDPVRLTQIIINLTSNAVKFTPKNGRVTIKATATDLSSQKLRLNIAVKDTGIGMDEQQKTKLFQSFSQADSSTTREFGGTGLGLVISSELCKLMDGGIEVESTPNRGSTFSFNIAVRQAGSPVGLTINADNQSQTNKQDNKEKLLQLKSDDKQQAYQLAVKQLQGCRILLVEDNEINQEIALEILSQIKVEVDCVGDGQQALDKLNNNNYDGVLMDCQMPVMDGYAATRELRKQEKFASLPILAMTANALQSDREDALAAGMNDHVVKPIDIHTLFVTMAKWISCKHDQNIRQHNAGTDKQMSMSLPEIPGLDYSVCPIKHKPEAYWSILLKFCDRQQQFEQRFRSALQQSDQDCCTREAHNLKGLSATLGMPEVQAAALQLEQLCRQELDEQIEPALLAVLKLLTDMIAHIRQAHSSMER